MKKRKKEHLNGKDGPSTSARVCETSSLTLASVHLITKKYFFTKYYKFKMFEYIFYSFH